VPKPVGVHIRNLCAPIAEVEQQDLLFSLLSFGLALVSGLLSMPPCLPSAMGLFTLCSFLVDFTGSHSKELTLSLRGDFELRLLKNVGTV
jgi:hypothetical protein